MHFKENFLEPMDDSIKEMRVKNCFYEFNDRWPFDDNELFLFIEKYSHHFCDELVDFEKGE